MNDVNSNRRRRWSRPLHTGQPWSELRIISVGIPLAEDGQVTLRNSP
jgi:hypothetical protein